MQEITQEELFAMPDVAFVAIGHDLDNRAYVHLHMPSVEQLRDYDQWGRGADYWVKASGMSLNAVRQQWPEAKTLAFGCLCCCTDDLVEWNACYWCGALFEGDHAAGCSHLVVHSQSGWEAVEQLLRKGYTQGLSGRRCTQRTDAGKLGYWKGRDRWKHRFFDQPQLALA
jgi:hypothetical protein